MCEKLGTTVLCYNRFVIYPCFNFIVNLSIVFEDFPSPCLLASQFMEAQRYVYA